MNKYEQYWEIEKARRRRRWPSRFRSYLERHLTAEEIKEKVFCWKADRQFVPNLKVRHKCKRNPIISNAGGSIFSEERLRNGLAQYGGDTHILNLTTEEKTVFEDDNHFRKVESAIIQYGDISMAVDAYFLHHQQEAGRYHVKPYLEMAPDMVMKLGREEFACLNIATLLMEMEADYNQRKEEYLYYCKRFRLDNMEAVLTDEIKFNLWDEEKLDKKLHEYALMGYTEQKMLTEVARPWTQATVRYMNLVTEAHRDKIWEKPSLYNYSTLAEKTLHPLLSGLLENCQVFSPYYTNSIEIEVGDHTYTLTAASDYSALSNLTPLSDFPQLSIKFKSICTDAVVGYVTQAEQFNHILIEYFNKAMDKYTQLRGKKKRDAHLMVSRPIGGVVRKLGGNHINRITFTDHVVLIADHAMQGLEDLTEVSLPDTVTYIGAQAFYRCHWLKDIQLPSQLKIIRMETFKHCYHLRQVTLPPGLLYIERGAFEFCYSLDSIRFPASLTYIDEWAFRECTRLQELYFEGRSPKQIIIHRNAFDANIWHRVRIYVPDDCVDEYAQCPTFHNHKILPESQWGE